MDSGRLKDWQDTRFPGLGYRKDSPNLWRVVDTSSGRSVGPQYRTKAELLADLARYARENWGLE
jgi:hypothetical protein